jgi:AraC-like DNA-binding protein
MERENDNRVNQLFELREEARHQFAEATNVDPQKIGLNSEEQQLTERMLKAIENHMSDADYGVDQLAQDVFMSRSALYTKLRNMLGISPADFIRNVRLKHAANLLTDTQLPIGEIADLVGYNTHKAFATNFKKMFGMLPSEYRMPKGLSPQDEVQS